MVQVVVGDENVPREFIVGWKYKERPHLIGPHITEQTRIQVYYTCKGFHSTEVNFFQFFSMFFFHNIKHLYINREYKGISQTDSLPCLPSDSAANTARPRIQISP